MPGRDRSTRRKQPESSLTDKRRLRPTCRHHSVYAGCGCYLQTTSVVQQHTYSTAHPPHQPYNCPASLLSTPPLLSHIDHVSAPTQAMPKSSIAGPCSSSTNPTGGGMPMPMPSPRVMVDCYPFSRAPLSYYARLERRRFRQPFSSDLWARYGVNRNGIPLKPVKQSK